MVKTEKSSNDIIIIDTMSDEVVVACTPAVFVSKTRESRGSVEPEARNYNMQNSNQHWSHYLFIAIILFLAGELMYKRLDFMTVKIKKRS